ncbi:hypothetical protein [Streptomyces sp. NRRL S-1022]|uniref:hypothetical protein n=1 Tax=Streptomyces sp. NRRL S-1022 TaxID=1463880 RepID=UPI000B00532D|nr:hypothetical protein [Streptomyces sp. NRRL S-1022]
MTNLQTILERKSEAAADRQAETRAMVPFGYRDSKARPIILSNRIHRRRAERAAA